MKAQTKIKNYASYSILKVERVENEEETEKQKKWKYKQKKSFLKYFYKTIKFIIIKYKIFIKL